MHLLISGATGFIGRHLLSLLPDSWKVSLFVRTPPKNLPIQPHACLTLEDLNTPPKVPYDAIIHMAARVHQMQDHTDANPLYFETNRDMTLKLATYGLQASIRKFVFLSSVKVMGEGWLPHSHPPLNENDACRPIDAYGRSKWEAEQALHSMFSQQVQSESSAHCVILRLPMVYGPHNRGNMQLLLRCAEKGLPLPLGAAQGKRSMMYVKNACDAILTVLMNTADQPFCKPYFINDQHDLTSGELYAMLSSAYSGDPKLFRFPENWLRSVGRLGTHLRRFGIPFPLTQERITRLLDEYRFSAKTFATTYQWTPPFSVQEGVEATVAWHRNSR